MKSMKIVQSDSRGQIVIPKKIREELKIEDEAAFWIFTEEGNIILKKINKPNLANEKSSKKA